MLSYEKAKRFVEIFTDIPGVIAYVGVEFDTPRGRTIGKIPDAPNVRETIIDYYMGDDKNRELKNYILGLGISAYIEPYIDDVESIEFEIQTSIEEPKAKEREEILLKRASLMAQIAIKLELLQKHGCGLMKKEEKKSDYTIRAINRPRYLRCVRRSLKSELDLSNSKRERLPDYFRRTRQKISH